MITKNDWDDALDAWVDEERERLGGPPTPEKVVAYMSGELSVAEAARVRALLVYYPELTALLNERFEEPPTLRKPLWPGLYAVAAMLIITALTTLLIQERKRHAEPVVHSSRHELSALRARGAEIAMELPAGKQHYLITVVPSEPLTEDEYEIEILRGSEVLWTTSGAQPIDDAFDITIPGRFLEPATYTLKLYELSAGRRRIVNSYAFRVVQTRQISRYDAREMPNRRNESLADARS